MQSSEPEFRKYLDLVRRRKELFAVLALVITTAVFIIIFLLPKSFEASSTVAIEKNIIDDLVKGIAVTPSMDDTISVLTYAMTSRTLLMKVIDALDLGMGNKGEGVESLISKFQKNTKVKFKEKNLFTISCTDRNPRVARDFVNTLVRLYIEENMSSKRGESYDATKFLSEQVDNFSSKLQKAEAEVNAYKREKGGIIALDEGTLFEEINSAQQRLYEMQLRRRQLEGMRLVTKRSSDPLQSRLNALQKRLDELRGQYTDTFPDVVQVKGEIEAVQQLMKHRKGGDSSIDPDEVARINSEIEALKISENSLLRNIEANKKLLAAIPSAKAGLEKLEAEKNNQKLIHDQLYSRRGQSELSKQMEVQDKTTTFRVVDPAVLPNKPSSPDRLRLMLMGIVGGIAASFGILMVLESLDGSVKRPEVARELGVPLLAVIPLQEEPQALQASRRRSRCILTVAALYFLALLTFPIMEFAGSGVLDRLLDQVDARGVVQGIRTQLKQH